MASFSDIKKAERIIVENFETAKRLASKLSAADYNVIHVTGTDVVRDGHERFDEVLRVAREIEDGSLNSTYKWRVSMVKEAIIRAMPSFDDPGDREAEKEKAIQERTILFLWNVNHLKSNELAQIPLNCEKTIAASYDYGITVKRVSKLVIIDPRGKEIKKAIDTAERRKNGGSLENCKILVIKD